MKSLLVPELVHDMIFDIMKEHGIKVFEIRFDSDEFTKYNRMLTDIIMRGIKSLQEFEEFDRYNDEVTREAGE